MRTLTRFITIYALAFVLLVVPSIALAEQIDIQSADEPAIEGVGDHTAETISETIDQAAPTSTVETTKTVAPPKTYVVRYDPNGGNGEMPDSTFTVGSPAKLERCTFTRDGYTFEGWNTEPDGSGTSLADGVDAQSVAEEDYVLYAQWGSQIYLLRYIPGVPKKTESGVEGSTPSQLAVHDAVVSLQDCGFKRAGYTPTGWVDHNGVVHDFGEVGTNYTNETDTTSWELATIKANPPEEPVEGSWSCQGSVVFEGDDDSLCAAMAFFYMGSGYSKDNLDVYDSMIKVVNLDTGEELKSAQGIMLEHGNDIAYNPNNKHFYIAQGGITEGLPDGIVELDENLKEVRTVTPEGTHNIWNLSYSNGRFYAIGNVSGDAFARGNPEGATSDLIVLDEDLNVVETHTVDYSLQGFSGQGMVCDGSFLYSILVNFQEHESGSKQRLAIFSLKGEPLGTMRIDISSEVESASAVNGRMYFSVNKGAQGTIYGTDLANATMSVAWEANPYEIEFDGNGTGAMSVPQKISTTYDSLVQLPTEVPVRPGYEFVGWNTQADGKGTNFAAGDTVHNLVESGSVTLYAQWRRAAIAYVADNGNMQDDESMEQALLEEKAAAPRHLASAVATTCSTLVLANALHRKMACNIATTEGAMPA